MASISGVSSGNAGSIYGNRNVFTGLATGMDTESMIENAISGYKTKINSLLQKQAKMSWQQQAYRGVSGSLVELGRKYASFDSSTNLLSNSFFNKAVTTAAGGANASKISATGKSSSDVRILGVKQLAEKAMYSASYGGGAADVGDPTLIGGEALDLTTTKQLSSVSGSLTLRYGADRDISISFGSTETYNNSQEFVDAINQKLEDLEVSNSKGDKVKASTMVKAELSADGKSINLADAGGGGNEVTISYATGKLKDTLGIDNSADAKSIDISGLEDADYQYTSDSMAKTLSGQDFIVTVDGRTKTIKLPKYEEGAVIPEGSTAEKEFAKQLDASLEKAFGAGNANAELTADGKLQITGNKGSSISVKGDAASLMGLSGSNAISYLDTSRTLGDLLPENAAMEYNMTINGVDFTFSKNDSLEGVLNAINSNTDVGVNVNFSKITNSFQFTSRETGEAAQIEIKSKLNDAGEESNLGVMLFGEADETGRDAIFRMSVNGMLGGEEVHRSDNTFNVDGLSVTLKGTYGYTTEVKDDAGNVTTPGGEFIADTEAVTFTTTADADKIVSTIKDMVKDLNALMKSTYETHSALPNYKSNGSKYEPLTEDQKADMSETEIKNYEEKAKQGVLFGDNDLSNLYDDLLSSATLSGDAGGLLRSIGIKTSYENGLTTVEVDEEAMRAALSNNPDSVRDAFTDPENGMMTKLKEAVDEYAGTEGARKGILIEKAGSPYASLSLLKNDMQEQMSELDTQIDRWQSKMSSQIDYYTTQFSRLEQLTQQMNSQSSLLTGMMGG